MYGGRAIDAFDRRVLKTYMDEYMGDFIFDTFQPFHFFHNEHVDYLIPPEGNKDAYMAVIEELPLANTPEVFGLHANAEINYFTHATKAMWAQLVELQPQTGETGMGISREEFISNIATDIQVCAHTHTHTHTHTNTHTHIHTEIYWIRSSKTHKAIRTHTYRHVHASCSNTR